MVAQPLSPPLLTSDYPQPLYPQPQQSHKRKRQREDDSEVNDIPDDLQLQRISKKSRDEILHPIPLIPPHSVSSQLMSPKSDPDTRIASHLHNREMPTSAGPAVPSYVSHPDHEEMCIPVQNLLLRNLHMNSRVYQNNQKGMTIAPEDELDEEMWEVEEEEVAERYAQMNKILGSRKMRLQ